MAIILESQEDTTISPLTEVEKRLVYRLRVLLKDVPQDQMLTLNTLVESHRGQRWSDESLLVYLQTAMADLNSTAPLTYYNINNFPLSWEACVVTGGMIFALIAESIFQNGETFSYADNGISLNINLAQGYQGVAQALLSGYQEQKKQIKLTIRPTAKALKDSPAPVRIRSYAPRQWVYR